MFLYLNIFLALPLVYSTFIDVSYRNAPPVVESIIGKVSALDIMVDITNDVSYRVLEQHSVGNRNNYAFSPTSLMSVLIALYEGSQDGSAREIYNVLKLPWNRDLLRIGYRDVHRRLRKYFFNNENPLTGLSLSKENVTVTSFYEDILKFYGYDLGSDMRPFTESTEKPTETSLSTSTTSTEPASIPMSSSSTEPSLTPKPSSTENSFLSTTKVDDLTTTTVESRKPTTVSVEISTTISMSDTATTATAELSTPTSPVESVTQSSVESLLPSTTEAMSMVTTQTANPSTAMFSSTLTEDASTAFNSATLLPDIVSTTMESMSTSTVENQPSTLQSDAPETTSLSLTTTSNNVESTSIQQETTTIFPSTIVTTDSNPVKLMSTINPANVIFPLKRLRRPSPNRQTLEGRVKRHFPITFDDETFAIPVTPIYPPISNFHFVTLASNYDIESIYQPKAAVINKKEIYHMFYLNNRETIQARYKVYNSILRFSYIPSIRSSVLELELDSKDYELLIMVPDYGFGLDYLLQTLKLAPSLRVIRQEMKPRWVQAIVPDFKLKGNVFLTNDLQNMGIIEAFEPTRADFSPMTNETDIYVKHIEQSINVHLRTRPLDQLKRNVGPFNRPIEVSVNHPFVFFIIDKEIDVAIMTGRVLNPINVRIQ